MSIRDLSRADFVDRFGGVFEHSPWVAEAAYDAGLDSSCDQASGLHGLMSRAMMAGDDARKLALIMAHPDLAGRLARAGRLTAESAREQASAGLDQLTDEERARFTELNDAYKARFGFPFIMAVKGRSKQEIMAAFERRIAHARDQEFAAALQEISRIALLRLSDMSLD
jgi:OHCU decarboxylase